LQIERVQIPGVFVVTPQRFRDPRGVFWESYNRRRFAEVAGFDPDFVQDNLSCSSAVGTIRGLHFQVPPHAQAKLVTVLRGAILDVVVDLRVGSPTFEHHVAIRLNAEVGGQVFVPVGCAHGFCALEPDTLVLYKVTDFYVPDHESGLFWADPGLGIAWPVGPERARLSAKDAGLPGTAGFVSPFSYPG